MATPLLLQLFALTFAFLSACTTSIGDGASTFTYLYAPSSSSSPAPMFQDQPYPTSLFGPILADLGFHGLSSAAQYLSNSTSWKGPATVFAPTDSSLLTCSSCSLPLLLQEHTIPGLFPLQYLRTLTFGTKIETLAPGRCVTFTFSNTSDIFIGGVKITRPDLYNDGVVAVHGVQGFISHLSPLSCDVERMTSLSFPHPQPVTPFLIMRLMLKDTMLRLSISGYGVVALALKVKHDEILDLRSATVFALDDVSIFAGGGHSYITDFRFHVVPNRLLMAADLESLPTGTVLPTMVLGQNLVVTSAGGGSRHSPPTSINYVNIKSPDLMYNLKIVVHGLSMPFPHIHLMDHVEDLSQIGRSGWATAGSDVVTTGKSNLGEFVAPTPVIESMLEIEDHHGL